MLGPECEEVTSGLSFAIIKAVESRIGIGDGDDGRIGALTWLIADQLSRGSRPKSQSQNDGESKGVHVV